MYSLITEEWSHILMLLSQPNCCDGDCQKNLRGTGWFRDVDREKFVLWKKCLLSGQRVDQSRMESKKYRKMKTERKKYYIEVESCMENTKQVFKFSGFKIWKFLSHNLFYRSLLSCVDSLCPSSFLFPASAPLKAHISNFHCTILNLI